MGAEVHDCELDEGLRTATLCYLVSYFLSASKAEVRSNRLSNLVWRVKISALLTSLVMSIIEIDLSLLLFVYPTS